MSALPYAMFDADNHYYEPDDCFTRHIEARFARRGRNGSRRGASARDPRACARGAGPLSPEAAGTRSGA